MLLLLVALLQMLLPLLSLLQRQLTAVYALLQLLLPKSFLQAYQKRKRAKQVAGYRKN